MPSKLHSIYAVSALALVLVTSQAKAADVQPSSDCYLAGDVRIGLMNDWQGLNIDADVLSGADANWLTPFGEGRGLVSCNAFNFQSDFAYYSHQGDDLDGGKDTISLDAPAGHFGGALFWRDQNVGLLGISSSWIHQDGFLTKDAEYARIGGVAEYFVNDQFTIGASAHYFTDLESKDINHDGFELAANLKYYATPDLSMKLEGALLLSEFSGGGNSEDFDGFSIGLETEYLAWDQGLSLFAGGRYAEREFANAIEFDDFQIYAGIKFAFGGNTESLVARDRSGPIDNTSIFHEKLPNPTSSFFANIADEIPEEEPVEVTID
jgi:hypothetical protein